MLNDFRFALRQLRKSPGFTFVAVVDARARDWRKYAIFSVINAVLLQPLPYPDASRIMTLNEFSGGTNTSIAFPDYLDWRRDNTVFEHLAISRRESRNLSGISGSSARARRRRLCHGEFFQGYRPDTGIGPHFYRCGRQSRWAGAGCNQRSALGARFSKGSLRPRAFSELSQPALYRGWRDAAGHDFAAGNGCLVSDHAPQRGLAKSRLASNDVRLGPLKTGRDCARGAHGNEGDRRAPGKAIP